MDGRNILHFNHKTMHEIIQHYLDTVLFSEAEKGKNKVISVVWRNDKFEVDIVTKDKSADMILGGEGDR